MADLGTSLGALALIIGFPALLLAGIWVLGMLEAWMLQPDERAAKIKRLLEAENEAEDVEAAVTRLVAEVADSRHPHSRERSLHGGAG